MNSNSNETGEYSLPDNIDPSVDSEGFEQTAKSVRTSARIGGSQPHDSRHGEVELDTSPTNRVSNKYNPEYFQPLRWGIDSLYLSFTGQLHPEKESLLESLKKLAQSDKLNQQGLAQLPVGSHLFEVKDRATGMFAFILEDNCFSIQLSRAKAVKMPMAYVKISSEYLTHKKHAEIVDDLRDVLGRLGQIDYMPNVSRIDLFVDFSSPENMESWDRHAWVTRSSDINQYSVDGQFSGWAIGLGSPMVGRLYNKILELIKSQKGYLVPLWDEAGWNGTTPIWRMEFQFNREILRQLNIKSYENAAANLNGLWGYASSQWLRLTIPSATDKNRSRWPLHPLWGYLSSIDFDTDGGVLSRQFSPQRMPSDERTYDRAMSVLTSYMACEGITDYSLGMNALRAALYSHLNQRAMAVGASFDDFVGERVAVKAKRFNSMLNAHPEESLADRAEAYRKLSDGE